MPRFPQRMSTAREPAHEHVRTDNPVDVTTLERLRNVNAAELRFRLACELRKAGGRMRAAVNPPRWNRGDLAAALEGGEADTRLVHRARTALQQGRFADAHA